MLNYTKKHVNTITICVTLVICVILLICLDFLVFNAPEKINNQNNFASFSRIDKTDGVSNIQNLNENAGLQNVKTESYLRSYSEAKRWNRARNKQFN